MTVRFCYIAISDAFFTIFYVCYVTHARLRWTLDVFYVGILRIPHYVEPILYLASILSSDSACIAVSIDLSSCYYYYCPLHMLVPYRTFCL